MSSEVEARVRRANLLTRDDQLDQLFGEDLSRRLLGRMETLEEGRMTDTTDPKYRGHEPLVEMRRSEDVAHKVAPARSTRRGPRRWVPAALVAAVLLVAAPVGMFLADSGPTPVEIAEEYIEARNAYDADHARALVAEDFTTTEPPAGFRDAEGMESAFQQHEAYGFQYDEVDCFVTNESDGIVWVECGYLWTTELHRITSHEATPESLTFVIEDSLIQGVIRSGRDTAGWWDHWLAFLGSEHPEFRTVVVDALRNEPEATRELVEGMPEHLELYGEWVESQDD